MLRLKDVTQNFWHTNGGLKISQLNLTTTKRRSWWGALTGSGKSTLLRSLNLLERPESGTYDCDGIELDFAKRSLKRDLSRSPKNGNGLSRL